MGCGGSIAKAPTKSGYCGRAIVVLKQANIQYAILSFLQTIKFYVKIEYADNEFKSVQGLIDNNNSNFVFKNQKQEFKKKATDPDFFVAQVWVEDNSQSDFLFAEGPLSLCNVRRGTNQQFQEMKVPIYNQTNQVGTLVFDINFELDVSAKHIPYIVAPETNGKLLVEILEGNLKNDINLFSKIDPLVIVKFGQQSFSSQADEDGGTKPKWKAPATFTRYNKEDILFIEVWNFSEIGSNDLIGIGYSSITETFTLQDKIEKKVNIYFNRKYSGFIQVNLTFITDEPQSYFPEQSEDNNKKQINSNQNILGISPAPKQLEEYAKQHDSIFKPSNQTGQLSITLSNGDTYQGNLVNGKKSGKGVLNFSSGGCYKGDFQNDMFHGKGTLSLPNEQYTGDFYENKKQGYGILQWLNQTGYEGQFDNNMFHGDGEWIFINGSRKKGKWFRGNRVSWIDDEQSIFRAGCAYPQGTQLTSLNCDYRLVFHFDGQLYIINEQTKQIVQISESVRQIFAPFWLRLEPCGEFVLIDNTGQKYWSNLLMNPGIPPYKIQLSNEGKLQIRDNNDNIKWLSH